MTLLSCKQQVVCDRYTVIFTAKMECLATSPNGKLPIDVILIILMFMPYEMWYKIRLLRKIYRKRLHNKIEDVKKWATHIFKVRRIRVVTSLQYKDDNTLTYKGQVYSISIQKTRLAAAINGLKVRFF